MWLSLKSFFFSLFLLSISHLIGLSKEVFLIKKLKLWMFPQNISFYLIPPIWPKYIGEKVRTLHNSYGLKLTCESAHVRSGKCAGRICFKWKISSILESHNFILHKGALTLGVRDSSVESLYTMLVN